MDYESGELRDRVKVLRKQKVTDGMGGNETTLIEVGEYWAHVRPLSGSEITNFDRVNDKATYLFVFRNGLDINAEDTLEWDSEFFNIRLVKKPKNKRLFMEIQAERGVAL